jgi:hypothetical protein
VHHAPGVATLGRAAAGHRRTTEIGLWWPGVHRGLSGSEEENWGTSLRRRLGTGSPKLAGRQRSESAASELRREVPLAKEKQRERGCGVRSVSSEVLDIL